MTCILILYQIYQTHSNININIYSMTNYPNIKSHISSTTSWLNKKSNYLIDWTNVAVLLRSKNHRYSLQEMIPRLFIIICTITPLLTHRGITKASATRSFIAFVISHVIALLPLIIKRRNIEKQCKTLITSIKQKQCTCYKYSNNLNESNNLIQKCDTCQSITKIMSSVAKNEKATATWGTRYRNLQILLNEH